MSDLGDGCLRVRRAAFFVGRASRLRGARLPLHYKTVTSCFSDKHLEIETTKDTKCTKNSGKERRHICPIYFFVAFALFVVSSVWLRPKAALRRQGSRTTSFGERDARPTKPCRFLPIVW